MINRKFKPIKKDRLFYDRFQYCLAFSLDEANCLRVLDHASIDSLIARRKQWREITQQRWINGKQNHGIIVSRRWRDITEKTASDLHELAETLLKTPFEYKLVVSINQGYVYTNSLDLVDQLDIMPQLTHKGYSEAVIVRPKNTVQLKKSRHKYRTYFGFGKLTEYQKTTLCDFLIQQQQYVRLSPALISWMDLPFNTTQDYFFVDHDRESWLTMLNLVQPGLVRKTMHIITAK